MEKVRAAIVGRTVVRFDVPHEADEGAKITFDDGSVLSVGYSGCEGDTTFNGEIISDNHGTFDR